MNTFRLHLICLTCVGVAIGLVREARAQLDPPIAHQVVVRLATGTDLAVFAADYPVDHLVRAIQTRDTYTLALLDGADEDQVVADMENDARTVWVERNYFADSAEGSGRDFYFNILPTAVLYVQQAAWSQIRLAMAHDSSTGEGVLVAVLDTGVDADHEALVGRIAAGGWNFVEGNTKTDDVGSGTDEDGDGDVDEMVGHGTHVSGVIAFVAPQATILPIRVLDGEGNGDVFLVAAGIYHAIDHGADVINISVGSTYDARAVEDALDEARSAGIVVVAAAGNMHVEEPREYPATRSEVLGVAAVDDNDLLTDFSNYHGLLAISAPGDGIHSSIPDNLYASWDGTSMAAPMVAGAAALLVSAHPGWPANETRADAAEAFLRQSAAQIDVLNPGFEGLLGSGRLDAAAAVQSAFALAQSGSYPVGAEPSAICTADFDRDGRLDAATANSGANTISILLNQGDATLASEQPDVPIGGQPVDLVAGDLNGDGRQDLAVAANGRLVVLLSSGDGTLTVVNELVIGFAPEAIAAGDMDRNGSTDVVLLDGDAERAVVALNNGSGVFTLGAAGNVGARPSHIAVADLDKQNGPDVVVTNRDSNDLTVLLNTGTGSFGPPNQVAVGLEPRQVAIADLDGDGDLDAATADHDSRAVTVLLNPGDGALVVWASHTMPGGGRPSALSAVDLDRDGAPELVAASADQGQSTLTVLLNDGGANFDLAFGVFVGVDVADLATGDLDCDGDADLAAADLPTGQAAVVQNYATLRGSGRCPHNADSQPLAPTDVRNWPRWPRPAPVSRR